MGGNEVVGQVWKVIRSSSTASRVPQVRRSDDLKSWDAEFVKVDQDTLFDLILALRPKSNYWCSGHRKLEKAHKGIFGLPPYGLKNSKIAIDSLKNSGNHQEQQRENSRVGEKTERDIS